MHSRERETLLTKIIVLQWKCLPSDCEVKHDMHVEMENSEIWIVQAERDLDYSL